jgi:hypothetical protein
MNGASPVAAAGSSLVGRAGAFRAAGEIALAALLLSSAAIYNGFPLVAFDTGAHLMSAGTGHLEWGHSPAYSFFVFGVGGGWSLWTVVVVQGLIGAILIRLTLRTVVGSPLGTGWYLGSLLALAVLTSLPWEAGSIMADIFVGYVLLGQFLLGFAADRLGRREVLAVFVLTTLAIAVHYSFVPLALGVASVTMIGQAVACGLKSIRPAQLFRVVVPSLLVIAGLVLLQGLNTNHWGFAAGGRVVQLARLVADGPAVDFLREECPQRHFVLCNYLDELPLDPTSFLWRDNSILKRMGGVITASDEASVVVRGTVQREPLRVIRLALHHGWLQFKLFRTGSELAPMLEQPVTGGTFTATKLKTILPSQYATYLESRQSTGSLHLTGLRRLHWLASWFGLLMIVPLLAIFAARRDRTMLSLIAVVGVGLVLNALFCGALSEPLARYQSRIIWLALFIVIAGVLRIVMTRRSDTTASRGPVTI